MVRSPDLRSTHSPCRGDLLSRSFAQSCAKTDCVKKIAHKAKRQRFMKTKKSMLTVTRAHLCRRCSFPLPDQRVNAPASSAIKHDEQEKPAIEDCQFAFVRDLWSGARDRKKLRHRSWSVGHVNHKISYCHLAAADECGQPRD